MSLPEQTLPYMAPELPPDINERACMLVLNSIARYPRSWNGMVIAAESVLSEFDDTPSRLHTGVGIREFARIAPDGQWCADRTNEIHAKFGIPVHVTADQAWVRTYVGSGIVLHRILDAAVEAAAQYRIPAPQGLGLGVLAPRLDCIQRPYPIDIAKADSLYSWLGDNVLRAAVQSDIRARAENVRSSSRSYQRRVRADFTTHGA